MDDLQRQKIENIFAEAEQELNVEESIAAGLAEFENKPTDIWNKPEPNQPDMSHRTPPPSYQPGIRYKYDKNIPFSQLITEKFKIGDSPYSLKNTKDIYMEEYEEENNDNIEENDEDGNYDLLDRNLAINITPQAKFSSQLTAQSSTRSSSTKGQKIKYDQDFEPLYMRDPFTPKIATRRRTKSHLNKPGYKKLRRPIPPNQDCTRLREENQRLRSKFERLTQEVDRVNLETEKLKAQLENLKKISLKQKVQIQLNKEKKLYGK